VRWEPVAAAVCLLGFWATSLWSIARVRDGGPYWWLSDLFQSLPLLILCPALAISGIRHPQASRSWRAAAMVVLVLWLVSPQTWAILDYLLWTVR